MFKHQITLNNKTVSPITSTFYVFNLSTDSQYNNIEFKGWLINSGASTWLIGKIGQLKVL